MLDAKRFVSLLVLVYCTIYSTCDRTVCPRLVSLLLCLKFLPLHTAIFPHCVRWWLQVEKVINIQRNSAIKFMLRCTMDCLRSVCYEIVLKLFFDRKMLWSQRLSQYSIQNVQQKMNLVFYWLETQGNVFEGSLLQNLVCQSINALTKVKWTFFLSCQKVTTIDIVDAVANNSLIHAQKI